MTQLNLELTTKQVILLFKSLDALREKSNIDDNKEISDLIRYLDKKVFKI